MPTNTSLPTSSKPCTIGPGDVSATFFPDLGMLGASLRFRGVEMLRRIDDLDTAAAKGSTAGIPLLYPWANRLAGFRYHAADREIVLDKASPSVHLDSNGIPMHGVPWAMLHWRVRECTPSHIAATLDWNQPDLLAVFPFPHTVEMIASVAANALTIQTAVIAGSESPVPVSFGFHPYFGISGAPRGQWRFRAPAMRRMVTDKAGIPTGASESFGPFDGALEGHTFDDGFALQADHGAFTLAGAGTSITVEFLRGFRFAQLFAPAGKDYIAIEPMTAPTNALISGHDLTVIPRSARFDAAFRIHIEEVP